MSAVTVYFTLKCHISNCWGTSDPIIWQLFYIVYIYTKTNIQKTSTVLCILIYMALFQCVYIYIYDYITLYIQIYQWFFPKRENSKPIIKSSIFVHWYIYMCVCVYMPLQFSLCFFFSFFWCTVLQKINIALPFKGLGWIIFLGKVI